MFRALIVDDNSEDRELLKMEIERALGPSEPNLAFAEAPSVDQAVKLLDSTQFQLMTLDIEFDRMNEGLDALPRFFDSYPTLNIIVVSGKLNKAEVAQRLFGFTKDNFLKSKRWVRHFDVLDKKDDKTEAFLRAHTFAVSHSDVALKIRDLFLLAESYLEQDMIDKCVEVYQRIQTLAPGEIESTENLRLVGGQGNLEEAHRIFLREEPVVGALLLGYHVENRLKAFTERRLGHHLAALAECLKALSRRRLVKGAKEHAFRQLIQLRNKAIHYPATVVNEDFAEARAKLDLLEPAVE